MVKWINRNWRIDWLIGWLVGVWVQWEWISGWNMIALDGWIDRWMQRNRWMDIGWKNMGERKERGMK